VDYSLFTMMSVLVMVERMEMQSVIRITPVIL
jgi:hypothetical protein